MLLILDLDRTLNVLEPACVKSVRELAPRRLRERNGAGLWNWIAAHLNRVEYRVNERALKVVAALSETADFVAVNTGRPEACRARTMRWLERYFRVDVLLMRADGDFRPTVDVKRANYECSILPLRNGRVVWAFDDNPRAVDLYRRAGAIAFTAPECWEALAPQIGRVGRRAIIARMPDRRAPATGARFYSEEVRASRRT